MPRAGVARAVEGGVAGAADLAAMIAGRLEAQIGREIGEESLLSDKLSFTQQQQQRKVYLADLCRPWDCCENISSSRLDLEPLTWSLYEHSLVMFLLILLTLLLVVVCVCVQSCSKQYTTEMLRSWRCTSSLLLRTLIVTSCCS